nr:MAG TPA: stabilization protein [Caudoviricetes sp.]
MQLPSLDYEYSDRSVTDTFAGYNHKLKIADGEFYDTRNLTSEYYPLLAERRKRGLVKQLTAPGGLLGKEKLAYVDNGVLYYDGEATDLTGLTPGEKQLVSMGAYICIFPDKKYYNTADANDRGSMEAYYTSTGAVKYTMCRVDGTDYGTATVSTAAPEEPENAALWIDTSKETHVLKQWSSATKEWVSIPTVYTKVQFISKGELPGLFKEYDGVTIGGAEADVNGDKVIYAMGGSESEFDYIVVTGLLEQAVTQETGSVSLSRSVPQMDFICESQNRLWGCYYGSDGEQSLNEIYCCALGDFKNWRQYMGLSTDSWTASVGSDGPWTGAVNYLGYPTFFKEDRIHRVSISTSGAHSINETACRGVQKGSEKSLAVVNEILLYKSRSDVCAYQGGFPAKVSEALGDGLYSDAAAGTVRDRYYISMKDSDGKAQLFVYDVGKKLWMHEDGFEADCFARVGDELYALSGKLLYAMQGSTGEKEPYISWMAETGMLYYQQPDQKYVSNFSLRLSLEEGAELTIYIEYDSTGEWERKGTIKFRGTKAVNVPIRPRRCDHMRIRLEGKGRVRLYSIAKLVTYGSWKSYRE